jgi:hypothetical protein
MAAVKPAPSATKTIATPRRKPATTKPATRPVATNGTAAGGKPAPTPAAKKSTPKPESAPKTKTKLVRDSFTIPKTEYAVLEALKERGLSLARSVKKSELLRAGIGALKAMNDKAFLDAVNAVPSLQTGRPKHAKVSANDAAVKKS